MSTIPVANILALSQPYIRRQAARDWRMMESLQIVINKGKIAISELDSRKKKILSRKQGLGNLGRKMSVD